MCELGWMGGGYMKLLRACFLFWGMNDTASCAHLLREWEWYEEDDGEVKRETVKWYGRFGSDIGLVPTRHHASI